MEARRGVTKQQIASSIPDSLFMKVRSKGTASEIWRELEKHFQNRSRMVSIDLRRWLQDQRCPEKGDVIVHFAMLRTMQEDLASMGQPLSENDFYAIILGSLPPSFDPYISAVNATSSVLGTTLSADDLMLTINEEYEHRNLKSKSGKKDENVTLYSNDTRKVGKEAQAQRRMSSVLTVERKVTISQIVGLQEEEKKGKARIRKERENRRKRKKGKKQGQLRKRKKRKRLRKHG